MLKELLKVLYMQNDFNTNKRISMIRLLIYTKIML